MSSGKDWHKEFYGIDKPSAVDIIQCAIAVCGGEVELSYLESFILKNEIGFNISRPKDLVKYEIICKDGICRFRVFRFNERRKEIAEHLIDFYRF